MRLKYVFVYTICTLSAACGGGSDSSSPTTPMPDMGSVSTDSMTEVMVDGDMAEMPSGDVSSPANMTDAAVDGVDMQAVATDAELEPFPAGEQCGIVQQPLPTQSGVVYTTNFTSDTLAWYRTDGEAPVYENQLALDGPTIDLALDAENELLFVLHDTTREAVWYRLTRPTSAAEPLFNAPQFMGRIGFTEIPLWFAVDRVRKRLYTLTQSAGSGDGSPVTTMILERTDVSNPLAPQVVGTPITLPSTAAIAIDSQRGLLFLYAHLEEHLLVFDITRDVWRPLPELTFDLGARFDEPSQTGFSIKNFRVDEAEGVLYAARDQVPNSQALAFDYGKASDAVDGCLPLTPMTVRTDPINQEIPPAERTNLMGAWTAEPVLGRNEIFFVFAAWDNMPVRMVSLLDKSLNYLPTCRGFQTDDDFDFNFGCFIDGGAYDDHAVCVDSHNLVGVTSVPDGLVFYPFDGEGDFDTPSTVLGPSASFAVCH